MTFVLLGPGLDIDANVMWLDVEMICNVPRSNSGNTYTKIKLIVFDCGTMVTNLLPPPHAPFMHVVKEGYKLITTLDVPPSKLHANLLTYRSRNTSSTSLTPLRPPRYANTVEYMQKSKIVEMIVAMQKLHHLTC